MKTPSADVSAGLLDVSTQILHDLAAGKPPEDLAVRLCLLAEQQAPGRIASIMIMREDGLLHVLAAPSVPSDLLAAFDSLAPGPHAGSCGNAVYLREPCLVGDIPHDTRWDALRAAAETWDLQSCWSWPIWRDDRILGTFALTGTQAGSPTQAHLELLEFSASLAGVLLNTQSQLQEVKAGAALQQAMLDNSLVAIALTNRRVFRKVNRRMAEMFGYASPEDLAGQSAEVIYPTRADFEQIGDALYSALKRGEDVRRELQLRRADGSLFWCEISSRLVPTETGHFDAVWAMRDLSDRRAAQERLEWQARHDALTGLPNRHALNEALPLALCRAKEIGQGVAVGLLDLDDFKLVNDQWGHLAGDAVLQKFAGNLQAALREGDIAARMGGDEFVLVLQDLRDDADLAARLRAIEAAATQDCALPEGSNTRLGLSLGLSLYPSDGAEPDTLLRRADAALYSAKLHKADRRDWWLRWGQKVDVEFIETSQEHAHDDPYGTHADHLLQLALGHYAPAVDGFVATFYEALRQDPESLEVLTHLSPDEFAHLKARQIDHLRRLLSPDLSRQEHLQIAARIGHVHALVGVPTRALVRATSIYLMGLNDLTASLPCHPGDRRRLTGVLSARVQMELQTQVEAAQALREQYQAYVFALENSMQSCTAWAEFMQSALDQLIILPGMKAAMISAPDDTGEFVIELSAGLEPYAQAMVRHYGKVRMPRLQDGAAESHGPTACAWQNERICTLASYTLDASAAPWREAAREAGIRSVAAIPIRDRHDHVVAVFSLFGGYPAMFERRAARGFLENLGQTLSRGWQRLQTQNASQPTPIGKRLLWRQSLFDDGLEMHMQPIVDLQAGQPYMVEALARLRLPGGELVTPGSFLPWFGRPELTRLFRAGMTQSLQELAAYETHGIHLGVSVNLPLDVMQSPDCAPWVTQALTATGIAHDRLYLEILEGTEFDDPERRDSAVRALADVGVRLVMDDLGSGYSSLLRLRTLPFHTVKIDQGLVREASKDPERVIGFIGALVQLAQSLGLWVVVEGLETPDLVEAATLLGADAGQGYALAKPMPAGEIPAWVRAFSSEVDSQRPRTALGRLAQTWMEQHRNAAADRSVRQLLRNTLGSVRHAAP